MQVEANKRARLLQALQEGAAKVEALLASNKAGSAEQLQLNIDAGAGELKALVKVRQPAWPLPGWLALCVHVRAPIHCASYSARLRTAGPSGRVQPRQRGAANQRPHHDRWPAPHADLQ